MLDLKQLQRAEAVLAVSPGKRTQAQAIELASVTAGLKFFGDGAHWNEALRVEVCRVYRIYPLRARCGRERPGATQLRATGPEHTQAARHAHARSVRPQLG